MENKLTVIGIGKLGLCFALTLEKAGYGVVGVDISEEYIRKVNDKILASLEPDVEILNSIKKSHWHHRYQKGFGSF